MALAGPGISRLGLFHVAIDLATGRLVPLLEDCNPGDLIHDMIETVEQSPLLKAS
ncbi:hypothetical protein [Sinorhizobium americanum]|uniref:hypothetical protein n=1 Tax=Sinorhizobium sp. NG07B TaxID=1538174 RepID=UPI0030784158